jgi:hypothetical protein
MIIPTFHGDGGYSILFAPVCTHGIREKTRPGSLTQAMAAHKMVTHCNRPEYLRGNEDKWGGGPHEGGQACLCEGFFKIMNGQGRWPPVILTPVACSPGAWSGPASLVRGRWCRWPNLG